MRWVLLLVLLAGCGHELRVSPGDTLTFGTLEQIKCPAGQYVESVTPKYLPGGEVVTHLIVQCVRVQ